jgi:hypothetical protein
VGSKLHPTGVKFCKTKTVHALCGLVGLHHSTYRFCTFTSMGMWGCAVAGLIRAADTRIHKGNARGMAGFKWGAFDGFWLP